MCAPNVQTSKIDLVSIQSKILKIYHVDDVHISYVGYVRSGKYLPHCQHRRGAISLAGALGLVSLEAGGLPQASGCYTGGGPRGGEKELTVIWKSQETWMSSRHA